MNLFDKIELFYKLAHQLESQKIEELQSVKDSNEQYFINMAANKKQK